MIEVGKDAVGTWQVLIVVSKEEKQAHMDWMVGYLESVRLQRFWELIKSQAKRNRTSACRTPFLASLYIGVSIEGRVCIEQGTSIRTV